MQQNHINSYSDTRGNTTQPLTFTETIVKGIAQGGGLFVPQVLPHFSLEEITALGRVDYAACAAAVYKRFGVDLPHGLVDELMTVAYGDNFDAPEIAPVVEVAANTYVLELWHGPTSAFKDMALQCLPVFFSAAIEQLRAQAVAADGVGKAGEPGEAEDAKNGSFAGEKSAEGGSVADAEGEGFAGEKSAESGSVTDAGGGKVAEGGRVTDAGGGKVAMDGASTERTSTSEDFLILVATSGDTGKAALEGFKDRAHTGIIVFYPRDGVSDIQYRQMVTQRGGNVGVFGVAGNFDDCQTAVKAAFNDAAFNERLATQHKLRLSSANSINWGRLLPQIVYYMNAYAQLVCRGALRAGDELDICVPTGNFGNILAAWYAREVGVPVGRLFCASNENRVLTDFINTGVYDISDRPFKLTPSPSMDILVSSNLERQLFELNGRDAAAIRRWMDDLNTKGRFQVDKETFATMREHYSADWVTSDECLETIREVFESYDYLLDPHSAVAWKVAERLRGSNPVLVVSTAHWAKFGTDVYRALNGLPAESALPDAVAQLGDTAINQLLSDEYGAGAIPAPLSEISALPVRFSALCPGTSEGVQAAVTGWLAER